MTNRELMILNQYISKIYLVLSMTLNLSTNNESIKIWIEELTNAISKECTKQLKANGIDEHEMATLETLFAEVDFSAWEHIKDDD